ncbi:MAG: hypothetical protein H6R10_3584 [Rhodocyclaceae bacterium]|nr:hypothetical protein [Rhodocyclaceae bacterium]
MVIPRLIILETLGDLGKPGLAGALLLVATLLYGAAGVLPAREERARLEERLARAEAALAHRQDGPGRPGPPADGEAFYDALPTEAEVTIWVERIYDTAAAEQLNLARGEYVLAPVADTRLVRYQIFLPVKGDYLRIRRFVATALATIPGLGLENLSLQRQNIGDTEVDALIRFSLYLARP